MCGQAAQGRHQPGITQLPLHIHEIPIRRHAEAPLDEILRLETIEKHSLALISQVSRHHPELGQLQAFNIEPLDLHGHAWPSSVLSNMLTLAWGKSGSTKAFLRQTMVQKAGSAKLRMLLKTAKSTA